MAQTTQDADLSLSVNGVEVATAFGTALNHDLLLDATGDYLLNVTATLDGATTSAEATVFVMPETPPVVAPPAGIVDGINHIDDNTVILQWTAPFKDFIFVVGDFNGWSLSEASMMNAVGDGETFWIQLMTLDARARRTGTSTTSCPTTFGWPTPMPKSSWTSGTTLGFLRPRTPTCRPTLPTSRPAPWGF